ncbi:hypothetical protein DOTSEDRAFT_73315 [Dothistroma septosporum NZE10]|uniref:Uncharacterized protein n=1 Tax=Dothistroma septosporum (strain NZE10 / CBS 128990) TaxID=675120 RepID=N1PM81_DOTSN|nr:hypothetical protein DOTSEDRAFT_73315 [Dothistroma septosporum NZE10]
MPPLQLPSEIRNMTYRLLLRGRVARGSTDDGPRVWISRGTVAQPSVLRTCARIRAEAFSMYYLEYTFDVLCPGFDPANMTALTRQINGLQISTEVHDYEADPKWENAIKWLEAHYHHEVGRLNEVYDSCAVEELRNSVTKMFDILDVMKENAMPWNERKKVLIMSRDSGGVVGGVGVWRRRWLFHAGREVDEK